MQRLITTLAAAIAAPLATAQAQDCAPSEGREAEHVAGEASGDHAFTRGFGPGWRFELTPETGGWRIQVLDGAGLDLSQMTPPLHGPNPRELHGWHFRNAANTGPNEGDVNAPQKMRLFLFDPRLSGTGGWKPAADSGGASDQPGRGLLKIVDFGLADLEPGKQARMVHVKFDACLSWPSEYGASAALVGDPAIVLPETEEQMRGCGLSAEYDLGAYLRPTSLSSDFDGDGALDIAAPVTRKSDGKRAIAICRAGTTLDVLGLSGQIGVHLVAEYFDRIDGWMLQPKAELGHGGEGTPPPVLVGDAITIGKEDSSSALIYWTGAAWSSYWQGD